MDPTEKLLVASVQILSPAQAFVVACELFTHTSLPVGASKATRSPIPHRPPRDAHHVGSAQQQIKPTARQKPHRRTTKKWPSLSLIISSFLFSSSLALHRAAPMTIKTHYRRQYYSTRASARVSCRRTRESLGAQIPDSATVGCTTLT